MIRRLIRWLARADIAAAYEAGVKQGESWIEDANTLAYARGEFVGRQHAFEAMEDTVRERMADLSMADVAKVRKGMLH